MKIVELFNSIQGEGIYQGRNCLFVRFPLCQLRCKSCDTTYTWDFKESKEISDEEVFKRVSDVQNVVFTGGEPCLKQNFEEIIKIIRKFPTKKYEIETNGVLTLTKILNIDETENSIINISKNPNLSFLISFRNNILFNVSPKINFEQQNKNIDTEPYLIRDLQRFNLNYIVKFLFDDEKDIEIIDKYQQKYNLNSDKIYVQPIGVDAETLREKIVKYFDQIIGRKWNISLRSHVFLFGNRRNV